MQRIMNAAASGLLASLLQRGGASWKLEEHITAVDGPRGGQSPLHLAAWLGNTLGVELLLQSLEGGKPALKKALVQTDKNGLTPIDVAATFERGETITKLLEFGSPQAAVLKARARDAALDAVAADTNDGGYDTAKLKQDIGTRCDIDERHELSPEEFYHKYYLKNRPVVMRGMAKDWRFRKAWSAANLTKNYGELMFKTGAIPYSDDFNNKKAMTKLTLAQYVDSMFDDAKARAAWSGDGSSSLTKDRDGNPFYVFQDPYANNRDNR